MQTLKTPPILIVKDSLVGWWFFCTLFIVIGGIFFACPIGLCSNSGALSKIEHFSIMLMGSAFVIYGIVAIHKSPFTTTQFNSDTGAISIRRQGLFKKQCIHLEFREIQEALILEEEGTECVGHQLNLKAKDGRIIPLSTFWAANRLSLDRAAEAIRSILA